MANNLECEIKALISKEDFEVLFNKYQNVGEIREQDNIYFGDKKNIFKSHKCGMRIRTRANSKKLTLKIPQYDGNIEINQVISENELNAIIAGNFIPEGQIKEALTSLGIRDSDLVILTTLHTTRLLVNDGNFELCLDKNTYNNKIDYEVEVEGPSLKEAKQYIENFFEKEKILFTENHLSKYVRATML